jgi:flagellar hook assembly protein FlgD
MSRNLVPIRARLYKPRPSVFADRVILSFALTRPGRADLRVYDVSGRVVARLLSRECGAGLTAVDWDGRDDAGVQLPLGTYFVRLATDAGASVEKVVLTR